MAQLTDIEAIHQLKYRYVRGLDQKRWDLVEGCFAEDATASYGGGAYAFDGRDAIMAFLREAMGSHGFLSSHRVHQPEIEVVDRHRATGIWALDDVVVHRDFGVVIRGAAFYEDEYVERDGAWLIAATGYRRTYETMEPLRDDVTITADWYATDGRSTLPGPA